MVTGAGEYPPIGDYALIGDCRGAALVSRAGSVDWWCAPRFDSATVFARLLDWKRGGHCSLEVDASEPPSREYLDDTMVLATTINTGGGEARVLDFLAIPPPERGGQDRRQLVRIVEGVRGAVDCRVVVAPRFDYGEISPWIRRHGPGVHTALGGDDGLVISSDAPLESADGVLEGELSVRPGERVRLSLEFERPALIEAERPEPQQPDQLDACLERTLGWWRDWAQALAVEGPDAAGGVRSALVLKALAYQPTGAVAAAATTSLPEAPGGSRNWDYRYSWIRDSVLSTRSLARLGCEAEADAFRRFIERTAAGSADDLRIVYGVAGERRMPELDFDHLEGYRGAAPVRVGNGASVQTQLDSFGQLVDQTWRWHRRGHSPDDDYWRFIVTLVESAIERWQEPDSGIWEWRGDPRHFVHSKALCWCAVDRGLRLAEECMRKAPGARWRRARDEIREAIEDQGFDGERGTFVQAFGEPDLDAAVLRLPTVGFIAYDDEQMVGTVDAIQAELGVDGLVRRYSNDDGLGGTEGAFLACSFWVVECLARQRRDEEARTAFDRALATANDLGLFSEEYDPKREEMLGNFPQALTHLSHVEALLALGENAGAGAGNWIPPDD